MSAIAGSIISYSDCRFFFPAKEDPLDRLVARVKEVVSNILEVASGVVVLGVAIVGRATLLCLDVALTIGVGCVAMAVEGAALYAAVAVTIAVVYAALIVGSVAVAVTCASMPAIIVLYILASL